MKVSAKIFCLILLVGLSITGDPACSAETSQTEPPLVNFELNNQPLQDIIVLIAEQTGYEIVIDKKWAEVLVSGKFTNTTVDEFFNRVLRRANIFKVVDDDQKRVTIAVVGAKASQYISSASIEDGPVDLISGMTYTELATLHARQNQDRIRRQNDPNVIDLVSGLSKSELEQLHAQQNQTRIDRQNQVGEEDSNLTTDELDLLHARQNQARIERQNDPNVIDPISGLSKSALEQLHQQQNETRIRRQNDPDVIDPVSGLSNRELEALHERQRNERLNRE